MAFSALGLVLFGVVVGVVSGMLGLGGGLLLVPGLMLLFGLSQPEAQGTSLAVLVPPIGIFAAMVYYQHGYIRLPVVAWVAIGFLAGAFLGAKLVPHVPVNLLRIAFGLILLYEGFLFVIPRDTRFHSALPAGLGTLASVLAARLWSRKREPSGQPPPPSDDVEYRI